MKLNATGNELASDMEFNHELQDSIIYLSIQAMRAISG